MGYLDLSGFFEHGPYWFEKRETSPWEKLVDWDKIIEELRNKYGDCGMFTEKYAYPRTYSVPDSGIIACDLPGVGRENISITIERGFLQITVYEKPTDPPKKGKLYKLMTYTLPDGIDQTQITATYVDGVLKITIPTPQKKQPFEVKIS